MRLQSSCSGPPTHQPSYTGSFPPSLGLAEAAARWRGSPEAQLWVLLRARASHSCCSPLLGGPVLCVLVRPGQGFNVSSSDPVLILTQSVSSACASSHQHLLPHSFPQNTATEACFQPELPSLQYLQFSLLAFAGT